MDVFAAATIHEWEAAREIGGKAFVVPTISEALQKYFDDAEARHLAPSTIRKRRELLDGKLRPYCKSKGHEQLKDLSIDTLRNFRKTWKFAATSAVKRLESRREREKGLEEARREREKDNQEAIRERDKDRQESLRETEKARDERLREERKEREEAVREAERKRDEQLRERAKADRERDREADKARREAEKERDKASRERNKKPGK